MSETADNEFTELLPPESRAAECHLHRLTSESSGRRILCRRGESLLHRYDAIVYPTTRHTPPRIDSDEPWGGNAQLSPALEFPSLTLPAGFTDETLPVSIEIMTRKFTEGRLFELAYSYEQASNHRMAPDGFGPVEDLIGEWSSEMIEEWNEEQLRNMTVEKTGVCE